MKAKYWLALVMIAGVGGYFVARYTIPPEVKIKEKIVTKEVEVERKNVQTTTREEIRPDGTKITETVTKDLTVSTKKARTKAKAKTLVKNSRPQWRVGVGAVTRLENLQIDYTVSVERRILGPVFVGLQGGTHGYGGLMVGLEF